MSTEKQIIIIGAGPAGLLTAYDLAKQGHTPLILEARDRIGGRAHTIYNSNGGHIETGAEFVHGKLPVTLSLLDEAKLGYTATGGTWIQVKGGQSAEDRDGKDWPLLLRKLKALTEDMTLQDFLETHFPEDKYAALKDRAIGFAEGYDSADASRASAKALYQEWQEEAEEQYRIDGGYTALMEFLASRCRQAGCGILLSHPATAVTTSDDCVTVVAGGATFTAGRVVVALPLGVLQQEGGITFSPASAAYRDAIGQMGMGHVIKFIFRFTRAFWEDRYPGLGFLMSGAEVPTWWTQAPATSSILTGWMAGRAARAHARLSAAQLQDAAISSLSQLFSIKREDLQDLLSETHLENWSADPYTLGSYAYTTVGAQAAQQTLADSMGSRIFFAGEYMYDGTAMGTVEAAFRSGRETARKLLQRVQDT